MPGLEEPVRFACQSCGRAYAVGDELAGRSFKMKCKSCGHMIVVRPSAPVPAEAPQPAPGPRAEPHPLTTPFVDVAGAAGVAVAPPPAPVAPAPVPASVPVGKVPVTRVAVASKPAAPAVPETDDESDPFSGLMELKTTELQLLRRAAAPEPVPEPAPPPAASPPEHPPAPAEVRSEPPPEAAPRPAPPAPPARGQAAKQRLIAIPPP